MPKMGRHEGAGASYTEDCTRPSKLRERGTLAGAPTTMDGPLGRPATLLDGTNDYWVGEAQPNMQASCTVMAWVYVDASETSGMIWAKRDNSGKGPSLMVTDGVSAGDLAVMDGGDVWVDSGVNITLAEWHHIAIVIDAAGTAYTLYYDGALASGSIAITAFTANADQPWSLGADDGGWLPLKGAVSEFQAWDRILTADEISAIHAGTVFDYDKDLVSEWDMSNINPPDVGHAGNGNDGTGTGLVAATDIVNGPYNNEKALEFNGTDEWVLCGTGTSLNFTSEPFTLSAMLKIDALPAASSDIFLYKGEYQVSGYYAAISTAGAIELYTNRAGASPATRGGTLQVGVWSHVVISRSGATIQIFINGVEVAYAIQPAHANPTSAAANQFQIARYASAGTFAFLGQISDVKVHGAALLEIQAADLYQRLKLGAA